MFFSVPGLVLGLRDTDINNHPEDKLINFFFNVGGKRQRNCSKRLWHLNLKNATERREESKGKSVIKCWGLWNSWIQGAMKLMDSGAAGSQGPRRVTEGTCRQLRQIIRSAEGAVEGSGLCPESIRQAPLLLFVFFFFFYIFKILKVW